MKEKLIFSKLTKDDVHACMELFVKEYNRVDLFDRPDLQKKLISEIPEMNATTARKLELNEQFGFCIKNEQNKIIGFIIITEPNYIRKLAVAEEYQHKGLASELVEMIRERNEGKTLVVHAAEKVIPFYEKLGFVIDGEIDKESYPFCPMMLKGRGKERDNEVIRQTVFSK